MSPGRWLLTLATSLIFILAPTVKVRSDGPWHVASVGNDDYDCVSPDAPCATIGSALDKAITGGIVTVAAETYAENLTVAKRETPSFENDC